MQKVIYIESSNEDDTDSTETPTKASKQETNLVSGIESIALPTDASGQEANLISRTKNLTVTTNNGEKKTLILDIVGYKNAQRDQAGKLINVV